MGAAGNGRNLIRQTALAAFAIVTLAFPAAESLYSSRVTGGDWSEPGPPASALAVGPDGRIWTVDYRLQAHVFDGHWMDVGAPMPWRVSGRNFVEFLAVDGQGRVWAGSSDGVAVLLPTDDWMILDAENSGLPDASVTEIAVDPQGRPWVGTLSGLSVLDGDDHWTTYSREGSGLRGFAEGIAFDAKGRVWVATATDGISVLSPEGIWAAFPPVGDSLSEDPIGLTSLALDPGGRAWVGSQYRGLKVLEAQGTWTTYNEANSGLADDSVYAVQIDAQGQVWAGTGRGLSVLSPDGSWRTFTSDNSGLPDDIVYDLVMDGAGRMWVVTNAELRALDLRAKGPLADIRWPVYWLNVASLGLFVVVAGWARVLNRPRAVATPPANLVPARRPGAALWLEWASANLAVWTAIWFPARVAWTNEWGALLKSGNSGSGLAFIALAPLLIAGLAVVWIALGVAVGFVQWLVLRQFGRDFAGWFWGTALCWIAPFLLLVPVGVVMLISSSSLFVLLPVLLLATASEMELTRSVLLGVALAAYAVIVSLAQWRVLKRRMGDAVWWVAASALGWAVGSLAWYLLPLTVGAITGLALVWLLRQQAPSPRVRNQPGLTISQR